MSPQTALEKVTVFVTRPSLLANHERELLVFRHPHAGIQLPAGTVEADETPETAALRETWEETGLGAVSIVEYLGMQSQPMLRDYHMMLRRVPLLGAPEPDAAPVTPPFASFLGLRRGLPVRQLGATQNGYVRVAYEEFDGPIETSDGPARSVAGWIEADALTPHLVRHFFHLTPTASTPDAWVQHAEEWEHRFELFWVPLAVAEVASAGLIPSQARWLEEFAPRLHNFNRSVGT